MPVFLMRFSYTPAIWAELMDHPEDRRDAAREYLDDIGGSLLGFWYGFGEYDGYVMFEAPDDVAAAGFVLAINAGGAVSALDTTKLMTVDDTLEALAKGKAIAYRKPGARVTAGTR